MRKNPWSILGYILTCAFGVAFLLAIFWFAVVKAPPIIAPVTPPNNPDVLDKLGPRTAIAIIISMIFLLGVVFWLFINFGRRLSMRTYLGPLARDAIYRAEVARQEGILREDLRIGRFAGDIDLTDQDFKNKFKIPIESSAPQLQPGVNIDELGRPLEIWKYSDPWTSVNILGDYSAEKLWEELTKSSANNDQDLVQKLKNEINNRYEKGYVSMQLNLFYQECRKLREKTRERALELLPEIDVSAFGGGWTFVLEFTTIIFIVFTVLALGILGVLNSEPIATILAAIAGYVLGKSMSTKSASGEEIHRGADEPKILFEAMKKQEELKSLRDDEKIKLRREVEDLQIKLSQSVTIVPDVRNIKFDEAESILVERNLLAVKKEVDNQSITAQNVFDQSPEPNTEVSKGSKIILFVAI